MKPQDIEVRVVLTGTDIRCPVCEGRGVVPLGFYTGTAHITTSPELCRRCAGLGTYRLTPTQTTEPKGSKTKGPR